MERGPQGIDYDTLDTYGYRKQYVVSSSRTGSLLVSRFRYYCETRGPSPVWTSFNMERRVNTPCFGEMEKKIVKLNQKTVNFGFLKTFIQIFFFLLVGTHEIRLK